MNKTLIKTELRLPFAVHETLKLLKVMASEQKPLSVHRIIVRMIIHCILNNDFLDDLVRVEQRKNLQNLFHKLSLTEEE